MIGSDYLHNLQVLADCKITKRFLFSLSNDYLYLFYLRLEGYFRDLPAFSMTHNSIRSIDRMTQGVKRLFVIFGFKS